MEQAKTQHVKKKKVSVTIQQNNTKMIDFDYITKENIENISDWPQILDHSYRILIVEG